jgi:hypothetical protein
MFRHVVGAVIREKVMRIGKLGCVHSMISQRLLKGQLHKLVINIFMNNAGVFSTSIINISVLECLSTAFSHRESTNMTVD